MDEQSSVEQRFPFYLKTESEKCLIMSEKKM